jgi:DNA-binding NarL/FixJ family response regulator
VTPIAVGLVDDQDLVRAGLRVIVDSQDDMRVVGEAADGIEAIELARRTAIDVLLMDVRMPRLDGIEACAAVLRGPRPARVLILTTFDLDDAVYAGLRAGASGFLLKDAPATELLRAIRLTYAGDAVMAPSVTRRLVDHFVEHAPRPAPDPAAETLTGREREVLLEIAAGRSNHEIASELFLSEATVKSHVGHILTKLDLRDRVQAVIYAYEHGLVSPDGRDNGVDHPYSPHR